MLDLGRTFKMNLNTGWRVFEVSLTSAVITFFPAVLQGKEFVQYLPIYKHYEVEQGDSGKLS